MLKNNMDLSNHRHVNYLLSGLLLLFTAFWGVTSTVKYLSLGYFDWDLPFFNQAMWNMLHARLFISLFNVNFLGNHANFIAFIFLPFYALFQNALFLIYLKLIFMALGVIPLFLIARENLGLRYAIFFAVLYLLYPALNFAVNYEFDWENLSTFFLMWLFYFYYKRRFSGFLLASLLLLAIKENMSFSIFMFGIHAFFSGRSRRWYLFSIITSVLWFCAAIFLIIPYFSGKGYYPYWSHYSGIEKYPVGAIRYLFSAQNLEYIFQLFSPVAFISFFRPDILLLGLPFLLQHMLSVQHMQHTIYFNYASSLIPFVFISAVFGMKLLIRKAGSAQFFISFIRISLVICTVIAHLELSPVYYSIFSNARSPLNESRRLYLESVPRDSSVIATFVFLPALSTREKLYAFEDVYHALHYNRPSPLPPDIEYAVVDFNDFYLRKRLRHIESGSEKIVTFFKERKFGVIRAVGDIVLFADNRPSEFRLFEEKRGAGTVGDNEVLLDNAIRFGFDTITLNTYPGQIHTFTFYWHCFKRTARDYEIRFYLVDDKDKLMYDAVHSVGYRIRPVSGWQEDLSIEEQYNFLIPRLPRGKYFLNAEFVDYNTDENAYLISEQPLIENNTMLHMGIIDVNDTEDKGRI